MALYRQNSELLPERRVIIRQGRRLGRFSGRRLLLWVFSLAVFFSICLAVFGLKIIFHGEIEGGVASLGEVQEVLPEKPKRTPRRPRFFPCEVGFLDSIDDLVEPKGSTNFTKKIIGICRKRGKNFPECSIRQFIVVLLKDQEGFPSTGFDLDVKDKTLMSTCSVVVSSCIFGSSDFLRRPTSKLISDYSKENVC